MSDINQVHVKVRYVVNILEDNKFGEIKSSRNSAIGGTTIGPVHSKGWEIVELIKVG